MSRTPVGEIRPSQLLWTYGPGALIDLPNMSVVTMGIDRWEKDRCQPIQRKGHRRSFFSGGADRRARKALPEMAALREMRPAVAL